MGVTTIGMPLKKPRPWAFGAPAALLRSGGSIPVVGMFRDRFRAPVAPIGFGRREDGMHAAKVKFHSPTFHKAVEASIRFREALGARS